MSGKQRLLPGCNLRNPTIQNEQGRKSAQQNNNDEQNNQPPWGDTQFRLVERFKGEPGANVDEATAVEDEVDNFEEDFVFGVGVEVTVPRDGVSYKRRLAQAPG